MEGSRWKVRGPPRDGGGRGGQWDVVKGLTRGKTADAEFAVSLRFGKTLLEMTIRKLCQLDIRTISLFAEPQVLDFYRKLGFRKDPQGIRAMFW